MRSRTVLMVFCLLIPFSLSALTPEEKGLTIAQEMDQRDKGWGDSTSTVTMLLRTASGKEVSRKLRIMGLEIDQVGRGDYSLTVFDSPRDVRGTALLSHTRITEADDQWLYLPALKRVKRISSGNKSGPFVGSEFAYEDLLSQDVERFTYLFLREEPCGTDSCFVVERTPLYEDSGYTKQVIWIDQGEYRVQKIDFYDRSNTLFKSLNFTKFVQYLEKYWRATDLTMLNHRNGKSTVFHYESISLKSGLTAGKFDPSKLSRVR